MPYTLMKGLGWFALALALGVMIGWLLRSVVAGRRLRRAERSRAEDEVARPSPPPAPEISTSSTNEDLTTDDEASRVLGVPVTPNDLTLIGGIGVDTAELCHGIGIRTWSDLASTEVSLLQTMLADSGARSRALDPADWPGRAKLLAEGRWEEFKQTNP